MLNSKEIHQKIYAGFLGKTIGVRLGAPVEPPIWTYERIRKTYGNITGYLRDFKNFAADDDTNGPIYFIRAMHDYKLKPTAQDVGKTWMNYAADGHGMFWWGGYGISTEHTAYANMRAGIKAPRSGSIKQNGHAVAEQIGGQIFIDSWGWVNPNNPKRAADMAATAASVAHDGEGLHGARFVAGMIAAFSAASVDELFETGLSLIPQESEYARIVRAVHAFHQKNPDNWRDCRDMLTKDFGYDRYPGVCHIIPNAGAMALAMLYGEGNLPRTVEIATMCGWDTDCNAGNAGAIIGTFEGVQPGWDKYRLPINDIVIASGVVGTLNIVDIPGFARELASLALQLNDEQVPTLWQKHMRQRGLHFDFDLPGSTHGFRAGGSNKYSLNWSDQKNNGAGGALEVLIDQVVRDQQGRVFYKPFYRQSEFDDERYRPMLSPLVATGQKVTFDVNPDAWNGDGHLRIIPYVRRAMSGKIDEIGNWQQPDTNKWTQISFAVPETDGEAIDEIGILIEYFGRLKYLGKLYLANFEISGPGQTHIEPKNEKQEWGSISRFTFNRGHWTLEGDNISGHTASDADLWTGHIYTTDATISAKITPMVGYSHLLSARVQGAAKYYAAGFDMGQLVILREDFGTEVLAQTPFDLEKGRTYQLALTVKGQNLELFVDGKKLLEAQDNCFAFGMSGIRLGAPGRVLVGTVEIIEH